MGISIIQCTEKIDRPATAGARVRRQAAATSCLLQLLLSSWSCISFASGFVVELGSQRPIAPTCRIRLLDRRSNSHSSALASAAASDDDSTDGDNPSDDSLTLLELATRLRQVRAQTRAQFPDSALFAPQAIAAQLDAQLELCDQLLSTRFRNLALCRCEARPSSIHGTGLFATRDIRNEELITLYPGDALLAWGDEYGGKPGPRGCHLQAMYGPHVSILEQSSPEFFLLRPDARDYEVITGKRRSIVGDPNRNTDPAYLGQFANDAVCLIMGGNVEEYELASSERSNAAHFTLEGCHFATVATRDIQAGEEVLVSYGEVCWNARLAGVTKKRESATGKEDETNQQNKKKMPKKPNPGFGKS